MTFSPASATQAQSLCLQDRSADSVKGSDGSDFEVGQVRHSRARKGVADTSREAFHSLPIADYLQPKQRAVMALFTDLQVKLSRQQISAMLPMSINGVCGRVDSLLTAKLLEECGERRDPATGKRQKLLQLPRTAQGELA